MLWDALQEEPILLPGHTIHNLDHLPALQLVELSSIRISPPVTQFLCRE